MRKSLKLREVVDLVMIRGIEWIRHIDRVEPLIKFIMLFHFYFVYKLQHNVKNSIMGTELKRWRRRYNLAFLEKNTKIFWINFMLKKFNYFWIIIFVKKLLYYNGVTIFVILIRWNEYHNLGGL